MTGWPPRQRNPGIAWWRWEGWESMLPESKPHQEAAPGHGDEWQVFGQIRQHLIKTKGHASDTALYRG